MHDAFRFVVLCHAKCTLTIFKTFTSHLLALTVGSNSLSNNSHSKVFMNTKVVNFDVYVAPIFRQA